MTQNAKTLLEKAVRDIEKTNLKNKENELKKTIESMTFILNCNDFVTTGEIGDIAKRVKDEIAGLAGESDVKIFFAEFDEKYDELCNVSAGCMQSVDSETFLNVLDKTLEWFDANVPEDIPEIFKNVYRNYIRNYNSAFWSRV